MMTPKIPPVIRLNRLSPHSLARIGAEQRGQSRTFRFKNHQRGTRDPQWGQFASHLIAGNYLLVSLEILTILNSRDLRALA